MCLMTLKTITRTKLTALLTPQVLVIFINKLSIVDDKNSRIGQDPVFTRGDPGIEKTDMSSDEDESLDRPGSR